MSNKASLNAVLAAACLMFFALGALTAAIGPLLSEFSLNTGGTLAAVGGIYTALFFGALLSQIAGGPLSEKMGMMPLFILSAFVLAAGLTGMTMSRSITLLLALALFTGLGHGALDLTGNIMTAYLFKENSVTAVNFLNIFFGAGAFVGPALVSLFSHTLKFGMPTLWISAILVVLAAVFMLWLSRRINVKTTIIPDPRSTASTVYRSPLLWALGLLLLVYVGVENAMGGWATTYMQETVQYSLENASLVTAGFWLALTLGRMSSAGMGARLKALQVLGINLLAATLGVIFFLLGYGTAWMSILAVLLIGFGFGGVFPTTLALTTGIFSHSPGKAGGVITAMGSIGGMLIPMLQGVILENAGTRPAGYLVAVCTFAMLTILLIVWRGQKSVVAQAA